MQLQNLKRMLLLILLPTLMWALIACGGQEADDSSSAPATVEQEATAEPATQEDETTTETEPAAVAEDQAPAEVREATTVQQAAQVIDLRDLALPDGAELMGRSEVGNLTYQVPLAVADVVDFYESTLSGQGWQYDPDQGYADDTTASRFYSKNGYALSLSASNLGQGTTMVTLINHGNVDLRALPQMADAETLYQFPNTLGYVSATDVAGVVDFTRQELAAQGWQEYTRPNTGTSNDPNSQSLEFKQNGLELSAFISVAPAQGNKTSVQYSTLLLPLDLPEYDDVADLEYDKSEPYLSYKTSADIETLADFYRQEMIDLGWIEMPDTATITENRGAVFFANEPEQMALMLDVVSGDGSTTATLRQFDTDEIFALQSGDDAMASDEDMASIITDVPSTLEFLIAAGAQNLNYVSDNFETSIAYDNASDVETLSDFYRQALTDADWEEGDSFGDETFAYLEFTQGDGYLYIQLDKATTDSDTSVFVDASSAPSLTGNVANTTSDEEAMGGSSAGAMPNLPTPDDAQDVAYDADYGEITYSSSSDIETLVAFYRDMLSADGWQEDDFFSVVDETTGMLEFAQNDDTLFITMFKNPMSEGIDVSVDVSGASSLLGSVAPSSGGAAQTEDTGPLTRDEDYDGDFPLPANNTGYSAGSSEFRKDLQTGSPSSLPTVLEFYLTELSALGWKPSGDTTVATDATAKTVTFEGSDGVLVLDLQVSGGETQIVIAAKNKAATEAAGLLPPGGQVRIAFASFAEEEVTLTIADQTIVLPPGAAENEPDPEYMIDIAPGSYAYTLTDSSGNVIETDTIELGADETWGLIAGPSGMLPLQLY